MSNDSKLEFEARMMAGLLANSNLIQLGHISDERLAALAKAALDAAEALRQAGRAAGYFS